MAERGSEPFWARVMWQRHGVPMEDYLKWDRHKKLRYIAAEQLENSNPVRFFPIVQLKGGE